MQKNHVKLFCRKDSDTFALEIGSIHFEISNPVHDVSLAQNVESAQSFKVVEFSQIWPRYILSLISLSWLRFSDFFSKVRLLCVEV